MPTNGELKERQRQFEVVGSQKIDLIARELKERHEARRGEPWYSSDACFLPASEGCGELDARRPALRARARNLPDSVRVSLGLNILTEEGLPHFHRIVSGASSRESNLGAWTDLWTAEEDRHGNILRDYARETQIFNFGSLERQQFVYLRDGFHPAWASSPYELFTYTTLQEKATQISHRNTGNIAENYEPLLMEILRKVAEDEARHYAFYLNLFKAILDHDPNGALVAAGKILPRIDMPGISIPNFREYLEVEARAGIYTLWDYKELVRSVIKVWKVAERKNMNPQGAQAQEKICAIPERLEKAARRIESRMQKKTFSLDVVFGREFVI